VFRLLILLSTEYNSTKDEITVKDYYLSQRTENNCIDSLLFCNSNGMHLAKIESEDERKNFIKIMAANLKLFKDEVFISALQDDSESFCRTIYGRPQRGVFKIEEIFEGQQSKFLCESVEVKKTFESSNQNIDVKSTFFKVLGNFNSDDVSKNYYLSRIWLSPPEATKACKSFGMTHASPVNQMEYDNLRNLIINCDNCSTASIAIYRSENNHNFWFDATGDRANYKIKWAPGEPSNLDGEEHCAFFSKITKGMNDVPCTLPYPFICEDNLKEVQTETQFDKTATMRLIQDYYVKTPQEPKMIYYSSKENIKLNWFNARLMCQSVGMDIFTPETKEDSQIPNDLLTGLGYDSFHIGITSMGSSDGSWYYANSGKRLDYDLFQDDNSFSDDNGKSCAAYLKDDSGSISYQNVDCTTKISFICQKEFSATTNDCNVQQSLLNTVDDDVDGDGDEIKRIYEDDTNMYKIVYEDSSKYLKDNDDVSRYD
jgi:hypothetical protein